MTKTPKACCKAMRRQLLWSCDTHAQASQCPDALIRYFPKADVFGMLVHDGGTSFIEIRFCPWCGSELASMRSGSAGAV
ncbi:MAG: hypothetical protein E6K22_06700 [Gammaproteobacteria bacterium]|nr:MAG: hypothetical protein E6K22_06700 [Gammaproteobacteria bacterium]